MDFDPNKKYNINDLSPAIFWDVDVRELEWSADAQLIVERVLQYGKITDWKILLNQFGVSRITSIATQVRSLDPVSLSFISYISDVPAQKFRCYTERQLNQTLWNS